MALFLKSESGAVTVDWTVIAAAVVGLGVASAAAVRNGTTSVGEQIRASLQSAVVWDQNRISGDVMDTAGLEPTPPHAWRAYGQFAGWDIVTGGSVNVVRSGHLGVVAPNGEHFISLNSNNNAPATIARTIDGLAAGQTQTVSFNMYDNGNNSLNVYFGGQLVGQYAPGRNLQSTSTQVTGGMGDGSNQLTFQRVGPVAGGGIWLNDIQMRDSVQ